MRMKKFINKPENIVPELLQGFALSSPDKIREHAERAGIPVTDILSVADTVVVRPDPVIVAA